MSRLVRIGLVAGGVFLLLAAVVFGLLSIWSGDSRWQSTALLVGLVGLATAYSASWPGGES